MASILTISAIIIAGAHYRRAAQAAYAFRSKLCSVYLETGTEENVAYYGSRGYETLGEIHPLGCRMWRITQRRK